MDIETGKLLNNRFEVISLIGKGGMATVYKCIDRNLQKDIAIKVLNKDQSIDSRKVDRFKREFSILSKCQHQNIIEVYEMFELEDNTLFYSMELIEGDSLSDEIKIFQKIPSKLERDKLALNVLLDVARALECVHSIGIIHHDLNPNNILIIRNKQSDSIKVKLLDFGISLLKEDHSEDEAGAGTLHYKAPEQNKKRKLDFTSDIYAFGTLSYEVLSGEKPFDLKGEVSNMKLVTGVSMMHALRNVSEIKSLHPNIYKTINRMVQICMEKSPKHRYQSMREIIERLEDSLAELQVQLSLGTRVKRLLFN